MEISLLSRIFHVYSLEGIIEILLILYRFLIHVQLKFKAVKKDLFS